MNFFIDQMLESDKFNELVRDIEDEKGQVMISGLVDVGKIQILSAIYEKTKKPICIITYNEIQARKLFEDMKMFNDKVVYFSKKEIVTYDYIAESKELLYSRIDVLNKIYENKVQIIITTIEALMQNMISKNSLYKNVLKLKVGEEYSTEKIKETLISLGYERSDLIEGRGQFSVRGGIIDISLSEIEGIRLEFWGDELDSIRKFNISNQRSIEMLEKVKIYPSHEYILDTNLEDVIKNILKVELQEGLDTIVKQDIELIRTENYISKIDKYFNSFYNKKETLLDYLENKYIICIDEKSKTEVRSNNILKDNNNVIKALIERKRIIPDAIKDIKNIDDIFEKIAKTKTVFLERQDMGFGDNFLVSMRKKGYTFNYREVNYFRSNLELLFNELKLQNNKKKIVILGGNEENSKKINSLLLEQNINCKYIKDINKEYKLAKDYINTKKIIITNGNLSSGFECYDLNLLVFSFEEIFKQPERKRKKLSSAYKEGEKVIFSDLKIADFVVHKNHGIGQFIGVNTIKADGTTKDYIKIKYKGDDILYIPTNQLDSIRKYIGGGEVAPKLNKLGSKEWENTKTRVKSNLREVARELIELYARRQKLKGFSFSKDTSWQKQFEDSFPYQETDDQLRCIKEVKKDMEADKPMDRLLCGDVGYGKTEVAIRAAFKACIDQKQVAYLVPTTVLADQQYRTFKERMQEFPVRVELLNRFVSKKKQDEVIKKLKLGEVDVVIGTHRILSKDVQFKNLGLLIIDEEHRFGVKDKEKIKTLKTNIDVLTMTATPIPRTMHMSILGIRDMSVIYEPPLNRKPVRTYVLEYDEEIIKEAITKELERSGQVFYLYNKVESIAIKAEKISSFIPEAKVGYAHGKMSGNQIEEIMMDFIDKKIDILVCTTILESGIDIPNANTIIVENADRLGLAQLYQIRGRVGRSNIQAYAYITYKRDKLLSEVADKRLKAIKEFTEFGSGFKIAMRDLEIRGAGSLLGEIQHGHMEQVGYDTYCKLLDEVVKEIQGIEVIEDIDVQIDINISSFIPDEYIENSSQKIEVYQDIALCRNENDIQNIIDEVIDRYGNMPEEVENLIEVARIKNICRKVFVNKIVSKQNGIIFYFDANNFNMEIIDKLIKEYKNSIKFSPGREPYITYKYTKNSDFELLKEIKKFLTKLI